MPRTSIRRLQRRPPSTPPRAAATPPPQDHDVAGSEVDDIPDQSGAPAPRRDRAPSA
jgi:hypothetical protein